MFSLSLLLFDKAYTERDHLQDGILFYVLSAQQQSSKAFYNFHIQMIFGQIFLLFQHLSVPEGSLSAWNLVHKFHIYKFWFYYAQFDVLPILALS